MLVRLMKGTISFLVAMSFYSVALAQSAGSFVATLGPAWVDFGRSSATALVSQSAYGTFTSSGTGGEVRNVVTPELLLSYFITDNIAVEGVIGYPPKLNLVAQGNIAPLGAGGPALNAGALPYFATARAWAPMLIAKYYFGAPTNRFRPFAGVGVNYTWFSSVQLNPAVSSVLTQFGGPGGSAQATLSNSWNPVFTIGGSYQFSDHWYMTASAIYFPLVTHGHFNAVSQSGNVVLANSTKITGDPIAVFVGVGYRF